MRMKHASHQSQLRRLKRIEGQVRGLARMIEEERYCIDILTQLRAARAALKKVEEHVLREHVEHCVVRAVEGGGQERREKIDELLDAVARFSG